jgi:hypothetical protein
VTGKNTLDGLMRICTFQDYQVIGGYLLSLEEFNAGKAIGRKTPEGKSIMISWDGYNPIGDAENSRYAGLSEWVHIFFKTDADEYMTNRLKDYLDSINDNNILKIENRELRISVIGARPAETERDYTIFLIELQLY